MGFLSFLLLNLGQRLNKSGLEADMGDRIQWRRPLLVPLSILPFLFQEQLNSRGCLAQGCRLMILRALNCNVYLNVVKFGVGRIILMKKLGLLILGLELVWFCPRKSWCISYSAQGKYHTWGWAEPYSAHNVPGMKQCHCHQYGRPALEYRLATPSCAKKSSI